MTTLDQRVRELMEQEGLDTEDKLLVSNFKLMYLEAQRDQLKENLKNIEESK